MQIETIQALLLAEVKDLYSVERQLTKALPKIAKSTDNVELAKALLAHLEETKEHQSRLELVFAQLGIKPGREKCKSMEAILQEGDEKRKLETDPSVKNSAIIASCQRVEHYEMAGYRSATAYAKAIENKEAAELLLRTLREEEAADAQLSRLAAALLGSDAPGDTGSENATAMTEASSGSGAETGTSGTVQPVPKRTIQQAFESSLTFSQRSPDMPRDDYYNDRGENGRGRGSQERDDQGQFTSSQRGSAGRYSDDDDDRSQSSRGRSSSYQYDDDRGYSGRSSGGSYEGRAEGGRRSSQMQSRDEYGQFAGNDRGGSSRSNDDDYRSSSRRGGSSSRYEEDERGQSSGGNSSYSSSRNDDDDERGSYSRSSRGNSSRNDEDDRFGGYEGRSEGGRHPAEMQDRDEYGRFAGDSEGGRRDSRSSSSDSGQSRGSSSGGNRGGGSSRESGSNSRESGGSRGSDSRRGGRGGEYVDSAGRHYSRDSWERAQEGRALGGQHSHGGR